MQTLEQATERRMLDFVAAYDSGITELTGRVRRDAATGEILGRFGGLKPSYPEYRHFPESPKRLRDAIVKRSGPLYEDIESAVREEMAHAGFKPARRSRGKPTIDPHAGRPYCSHCKVKHTKGQHRFHGKGSFHRTHLWGFSMKNPQNLKQAKEVFAALMATARERRLSDKERALLARASQLIRYSKRTTAKNPKRSRTIQNPRSFRDLLIGSKFHFMGEIEHPFAGFARGPWIKTGPRTYTHAQTGGNYRVGSINAKVAVEAYPPPKSSMGSNPRFARRRSRPRSFDPRPRRVRRGARTNMCNPAGAPIYGQVIEIICRRTGPHACNAACKRVNHTYRHVFKSKPPIYGMADGSLVIRQGR